MEQRPVTRWWDILTAHDRVIESKSSCGWWARTLAASLVISLSILPMASAETAANTKGKPSASKATSKTQKQTTKSSSSKQKKKRTTKKSKNNHVAAVAQAPTRSAKKVTKSQPVSSHVWSGSATEIAARYRMNPNAVGYLVYDLDNNRVLESWQERTPFIPASVTKVPTAVAGLALLGPEHRFETTLWTTGKQQESTLNGDLYLKGGGDPGLQTYHLQRLAHLLKEAGISKVNGRLLYDNSLYAETPQIDPIQPEDVGYNPGIGALSVSYNRMSLLWNTTKGETRFTPSPFIPGVRVNPLGTVSKPKTLFVYEDQNNEDYWQTTRRISGSGGLTLPVKRVGRYTARLFAQQAKNDGIQLPDPQPNPTTTPANATLLASQYGLNLMEMTRDTLKHSNNMMAEMIGLAAAHKLSGKAQTLAEASAQVRRWWKQQAPGVDWTGFDIPNFSGLASAGRITPLQMVEILRIANGPENNHETFMSRLPISPWRSGIMASESGSKRTKVWVKTGTMYYGRALTGVIVTRGNHRLAFAIFNTDLNKRQALDSRLFGAAQDDDEDDKNMSAPSDAEAKAWLARAKTMERTLVTRWALTY